MTAAIDGKALKLLTLALDPAAQPGEVDNAAVKFVRHCRDHAYTVESIFGLPVAQKAFTFKFGKFKGVPIDEVDSGYIEWALENLHKMSPKFRAQLMAELKRRTT